MLSVHGGSPKHKVQKRAMVDLANLLLRPGVTEQGSRFSRALCHVSWDSSCMASDDNVAKSKRTSWGTRKQRQHDCWVQTRVLAVVYQQDSGRIGGVRLDIVSRARESSIEADVCWIVRLVWTT